MGIVEEIEKNMLFLQFALKSTRVGEEHENSLNEEEQKKFLIEIDLLLVKYDKYTSQYNNLIIIKAALSLRSLKENPKKLRLIYDSLVNYSNKNYIETGDFDFSEQLSFDLLAMAFILNDLNELVRLLNGWLTLGTENLDYENVFYYLSRILQRKNIDDPEIAKNLERLGKILLGKLKSEGLLEDYTKELYYLKFFLTRRVFLTGTEAEKQVQYDFFNDLVKNNKTGAVQAASILYEYEKEKNAIEKAVGFLNYIIKLSQGYELESIQAKLKKMLLLIDSSKKEDVTYVFQAGSSFRFINLKNIYNKHKNKFTTLISKRKVSRYCRRRILFMV